jgi:hypothetical protein
MESICEKTEKELNKICINFGFNTYNKTKEELCKFIKSLYNKPTYKKLLVIARVLKINTINKYEKQLISDIILFIKSTIAKSYSTSLLECNININKIVKQIDKKEIGEELNKNIYFIINTLYNHIFPKGFPIKAPISVEYNDYKKLVKLYVNKKLKSSTEKKNVEKMLYTKLCYCIKKIELNNIFKEKFLDLKKKVLPYPVCLKSIYINRKIKIPKSGVNKCKENFGWYRGNNYRGVI